MQLARDRCFKVRYAFLALGSFHDHFYCPLFISLDLCDFYENPPRSYRCNIARSFLFERWLEDKLRYVTGPTVQHRRNYRVEPVNRGN